MALTQEQKQQPMMSISSNELERLISEAIKKVAGRKENDLCRYLPMTSGGYMHHFTLKKMKHRSPELLQEMIKTFIIEVEKPRTVEPKKRAARGSRKRKDHIVLSKSDMEEILNLARQHGNKEIITKFTPKKDFKTLKKELITSIKHGRVEQELWNTYVELISQSVVL